MKPLLLCAQVSPLSERLRDVPGAKMVVDVVQINNATGAAQLRKVVQFVCGNALVCDTIKEAKSVAFDGRERIKVRFSLKTQTPKFNFKVCTVLCFLTELVLYK